MEPTKNCLWRTSTIRLCALTFKFEQSVMDCGIIVLFIYLEKRGIIPVYFSLYPLYANCIGGAKNNALQFPIL